MRQKPHQNEVASLSSEPPPFSTAVLKAVISLLYLG